MILKKPYAFLIRHFKFLHLIMCALLVFIAFKTNDMLHYFTEYINAGYYIKIGDVVGDYVSVYLYASLLLALAMYMTLIVLLHIKDKGNLSYILMFVLYVIVTTLIITGHVNLLNMQLEVIDFRQVKLFRDFMFISMFLQYIAIVFMLIRGLGFNVKKFNFDKEIDDLEISSSDNAEFEFTVELNTNTFQRKLRSKRRHLRYFFIEHKPLFLLIGIIVVLTISGITFVNIGQTVFMHKEKVAVKINNNTIVVNNSYITQYDYLGKVINSNYTYLIVNFDIKNIGSETSNLDASKFKLITKKAEYSAINTDENKLFDFGEYYKSNKLKPNTSSNYIVVFKIPTYEKNSGKYVFRYSASQMKNDKTISKNFDIKLTPITSFSDEYVKTVKLNEKNVLTKSIFGETKIIIESFEINDNFKATYKFCISKTECKELESTIIPTILNDDSKTVIKIKTEVTYDDRITSSSIKDKSNLLSKLGTIEYETEEQSYSIKPVSLTPDELKDDNYIYLEVPSSIKEGSKIKYILNIRGSKYTYILSE